MKKYLILCLLMISSLTLAQRGKTGDKTFKDRFSPEVFNEVSNASLVLINEVDHDIIVSVRDQEKKFLRHVYIRNNDQYVFKQLPITRLYVQFKSKDFYYEDRERTNINYGEKHTFNFFFDASKMGNYYQITEEDFFKP
ncbi:hypothetical protein OAN99_05010 [Flavobacteriaceae bacterium]|nr:hypothetical protein [Flavobacteriaceae bacterium]